MLSKKDSLINLFQQNGLLYNEWSFLDEKLKLFVAVNPKINIYIDNSLNLGMYKRFMLIGTK